MQVCNVILPTPFILYCIFGVIILNNQLLKCTKIRVKSHKIAYKTSKKSFAAEALPQTPLGELTSFFIKGYGDDGRVRGSAGGPWAKKVENHCLMEILITPLSGCIIFQKS